MQGILPKLARLALCIGVAAQAACARNVPQDSHSGEDGKIKGARLLELENGEGTARGIVTYPGGDRVDWRLIELPNDQRGTLNLKLSWSSPRPGLSLGLDVFDEWGAPVASARGGKRKSSRRSRTAEVSPAGGKYFVRIYAPARGDAGKYLLKATFAPGGFDPGAVSIPDPPALPALPEAEVPCDELSFDKKNPACRAVCPSPPDLGWPGCAGRCPMPPDASIPACLETMECPSPINPRVKKCCYPTPVPGCANYKAAPVDGKIINVQASSDGAIITINRGSEKGIDRGWKGRILRANGTAIDGGEFTVIKVTKRESVAKVRLTTDTVQANPNVRFEAP
jgi:hypothetical protein